jgi:hypothetical protein
MAVNSNWRFILTDWKGNVLGELLDLADRKLTMPLKGIGSISFRITVDHRFAGLFLSSVTDLFIKVYRGSLLVMTYLFLSAEENSVNSSISIQGVDPLWVLSKRVIGNQDFSGKTGFKLTALGGGLLSAGAIAVKIVETLNSTFFCGVTAYIWDNQEYPVRPTPPVNQIGGPYYLKNSLDAFMELAAPIGSFEWRVNPIEPFMHSSGWLQFGEIQIFDAQNRGHLSPAVVFEYGTGSLSMTEYTRQFDRSTILTNVYITAPGWPDGTSHNVLVADGPLAATIGLREDVVPDNGLADDNARYSVIDGHIAIRSKAREVITFKTAIVPAHGAVGIPQPILEYNTGDIVRGVAVVRGNTRFDANFRIWNMSVEIDANGSEQVELGLVPSDAGG